MKRITLLLAAILIFLQFGFSQTKTYWSSGGEMIFSFATIDNNGDESGNIMRWAPVFNLQGMFNADFSNNVGMFAGLAIRNVGYIYDNYTFMEDNQVIKVKKKFRTYNLGLPVGIKLGNLKKFFVYGGYEVEFPFHYKEKTFRDEKKDKLTTWFSDRVEQFQHGFLVGIQLPYGGNIKFKYYLSEFHNRGYTESNGNKPYENLSSNIFYISLNYNLFTPAKTYYSKESRNEYY
jgi:hypothetical protein